MLKIDYSARFKKEFNKLSPKIKEQVKKKIDLLTLDEFNLSLNNHKLKAEYQEYRSINVNGDMRIIYSKEEKEYFFLLAIGTHSQLYK